jgi:acylphosphatase
VWTRLGVIHPVISYSTEAIEIYAAKGLSHVGAKLDPGEFLEVHEMSTDELHAALDEGRLTDAKSIAALALHERWMRAATRSVDVRVRGRVQGVGYRDFACREAAALGVTGFVRNRGDGSVEAHVQGSREPCDAFVERCRRGPRASSVERIEIARAPEVAALTQFRVRSSV